MRPTLIAIGVLVLCGISAAIGFYFGFREALPLGLVADFAPRGVIATQYIGALRAGKTEFVIDALESDVDLGLLWSNELLEHPVRGLLEPVWGFSHVPDIER